MSDDFIEMAIRLFALFDLAPNLFVWQGNRNAWRFSGGRSLDGIGF